MKFYSSETMRLHAQDLTKELEVRQMPEALRHFIINKNDGEKLKIPMYALGAQQAREWSAIGVLDWHDLSQECYCALIRAYNRVNWDDIEASDNPGASLWAYLKKSVKLDVRKAINTYKDGMRIPLDKIWEAKSNDNKFNLDNFFSIPKPNLWFWENDEILALIDDSRMTRWETEVLYEGLQGIMEAKLTDLEKELLELCYGLDRPFEKPMSQLAIAEYFKKTITWVQTKKFRALKKLKNDEVRAYLENYTEI